MTKKIIKDWKETIFSQNTKDFVHLLEDEEKVNQLRISLRLSKKAPVKNIFIRVAPFGEELFYPMTITKTKGFFSYYSKNISLMEPVCRYRFFLETDDATYWYNSRGISTWNPADTHDFKFIMTLDQPTWLKERVFYQIFPDRFFDGDPSRNVKPDEFEVLGNKVKALAWSELQQVSESSYPSFEFYGGDISGIRKKISYLLDLGITGLYLNPIFEALSNHKYDTINYKEIDPHFGSKDDFIHLVTNLHQHGIKIILDAVINHTGEGHHWFNRLGWYSAGAYTSKTDPKRNYYIFHSEDNEDYACWLGHKSLPLLNFACLEVRNELYKNDDSVLQYWMKPPFFIDGWRFDVANMLARNETNQNYKEIWSDIRSRLKQLNPEAYLVGEHFFDPVDLLDGSALDGVMNYQNFCLLIREWLSGERSIRTHERHRPIQSKLSARDVSDQIQEFLSLIPFQLALLNLNLLGSHDLPRILTVLKGDLDKYKLALVLQFSFVGVPLLYYGDEVGLDGGKDPDCRRPMPWKERTWNSNIRSLYKQLISFRKSTPEVQQGSIQFIASDTAMFCYIRSLDINMTLVCVNYGTKPRTISLPVWKTGVLNNTFQDILTGQKYLVEKGVLTLTVRAIDSFLLRLL